MSARRLFSFAILVILAFAYSSTALAVMPQITGDVDTEFGIYSPYMVDVVPDVPRYFPGPDLANVTNIGDFQFTDKQKALLAQNAFVAGPTRFKQVYDVYNYCQELGIPIFVL